MFRFEVGQLIHMNADVMDSVRIGDEVKVIDREQREEFCGSVTTYYQVQSTNSGKTDWIGEHDLTA